MNVNDKAIQVLSKVIKDAVAYQIATAPFDITMQGIVKDKLENNYYNIEIHGNIYKIKSENDLSVNDFVNIMLPQNNSSNMFIIPNKNSNSSGGTTGNVISVNGKTGVVNLSISDIPNLQDILNNKLSSDNIIQGNNIILNKNGNDITISAKDTNFEFIQSEPSNEWTIVHNLNKYPSVTIIDSSNTQIFASVNFIDKNTVKLNFNGLTSGIASLN